MIINLDFFLLKQYVMQKELHILDVNKIAKINFLEKYLNITL